MKIVICISLILFFFPIAVYADMSVYAEEYLQTLEARNAAVFYSQCNSEKPSPYVATLLFEIGSRRGLLIETKKPVVVNLATVIINDDGLEIIETHGGEYTRKRVIKLINELIKIRFKFLSPFRIEKFKADQIGDPQCINL